MELRLFGDQFGTGEVGGNRGKVVSRSKKGGPTMDWVIAPTVENGEQKSLKMLRENQPRKSQMSLAKILKKIHLVGGKQT